MKKKTKFYVLITLIILICAIFYLANVYRQNKVMGSNYTTSQEYAESIDYSCKKDSDCAMKDVHNCCGEYLKCTNKDAKVDAQFVESACRKEAIGSLCGYPEIKGCKCIEKRCQSK